MPAAPKAILLPGTTYHIINRGNNRRDIFIDDQDYFRFLFLLEKYIAPIATIQAFALLPNHFHLAVTILKPDELPQFYLDDDLRIIRCFGHLQNAYAKYFIHRNKLVSGLFERSFERYAVESETYFKALVLYLHFNPVKHQLEDDYSSYPWTSYQELCSDNYQGFLDQPNVWSVFGSKIDFIQAHQSRERSLIIPIEEDTE